MFARCLLLPFLALLATAFFSGNCRLVAAQEAEATEQPQPVTTLDAEIPLDHLELFVKPLTKDELAIEAAAWRDLLKAKIQEMSDLQVAVKTEKNKVDEAKKSESTDATKPEAVDAEPSEDEAAQAEARKSELANKIPELQEQRVHLIDRLEVVLDAWEAKGGEVEEYRNYVTAVSGLDLDVSDASTAWTAIAGWLRSEQGGQRWLWNIIKFISILLAFFVLSRLLGLVTGRAAARIKGGSELLRHFLEKSVRQLVIVVGLIVALSALEVNISPLLAALGAAAFVVGLALQGTLSNFASGLIILGYRPFDVGDVIDAGGVSGIVDSMNLISTKIRTFDNKVMIVPNNKIASDTITNASASDKRRVDLVFGIGYSDDVEAAHDLLQSIVKNHPDVLDDPAPVVQLNELADSSVNFICRPWVNADDYWKVYWDITRAVKVEFDRAGISIPFPQRDVHVYQQIVENGSKSGRLEQKV
jgi:small conductance mechanosensitive channel